MPLFYVLGLADLKARTHEKPRRSDISHLMLSQLYDNYSYLQLRTNVTCLTKGTASVPWAEDNQQRYNLYSISWKLRSNLNPLSTSYVKIQCSSKKRIPSVADIPCSGSVTPVAKEQTTFYYSTNLPDINKRSLYVKLSVVRNYNGKQIEERAYLVNVKSGKGIAWRK